jgi:cleavage stimulation factor subunit 3
LQQQETKGNLASFKEKMAKAYDYALDHIGIDNLSYPIWNEYVMFLKNVDATGSYAENQKITATRKIYQRGIVNPMASIEQLWKDYVLYEQSINPIIADKMTSDRAKEYMKARQVSNEYQAVTRGLNRNAPAVPPTGSSEEIRQVEGWRRYIAWEKSNPLKCEDESEVVKRVVFAYEQALLCMAHHPDIWYEYASYLEEHARSLGEKADSAKKFNDDAAAVFERATTTLLRSNILLHVAFADFEEARNRKAKATEIYEKLLTESSLTDPTLVYVHYMRYVRRSEGMKNFRTIFKKAREDTRTGHQAYTASALIEYYCHKDRNVATKIFELGLKRYPAAVEFILAYIEYQITSNEENNTRVLFERVLTSAGLEGEKSIEVWNKFLEFEANVGDLSSITKVEKRRAAAVQKSNESRTPTSWLVDRYKFMDLMPCTPAELKSIGYEVKALSSGSGITNGFSNSNNRSNGDASIRSSDSPKKKAIKPDVRQMIPFKPAYPTHQIQGVPHSVRGGVFPPPPAVASLLSSLPHPSCFQGPFVSIDQLMAIFIMNDVISNPNLVLKNRGVENGHSLFKTAMEAAAGRSSPQTSQAAGNDRVKVKREHDDEDEADDNSNSGFNPGTDIYRNRKLKNAKLNM